MPSLAYSAAVSLDIVFNFNCCFASCRQMSINLDYEGIRLGKTRWDIYWPLHHVSWAPSWVLSWHHLAAVQLLAAPMIASTHINTIQCPTTSSVALKVDSKVVTFVLYNSRSSLPSSSTSDNSVSTFSAPTAASKYVSEDRGSNTCPNDSIKTEKMTENNSHFNFVNKVRIVRRYEWFRFASSFSVCLKSSISRFNTLFSWNSRSFLMYGRNNG